MADHVIRTTSERAATTASGRQVGRRLGARPPLTTAPVQAAHAAVMTKPSMLVLAPGRTR
ncbi:hypothetical protein ACRYCC_10175 [Actinomadura scrupuli]|uniref:hypothetical protein n=1 Tax=Actinomadura scrupuli TaxID=559629 RepID=UPI003D99AA88